MPRNPRIGLWGNYGFQKPFRCLGRWVGPQLDDYLIGTSLVYPMNGRVVKFHVNVLFDRQKPRHEQLETILVLDSRELADEMWLQDEWEKDNGDEDGSGTGEEVGALLGGGDERPELPW